MKYSKKDSVDTFKAVSRTTKDYSRGTGNKSISFTQDERRKSDKQIMSVYADGLMRKAHRQMKANYKQTGFYETNAERVKRESKLMEEE